MLRVPDLKEGEAPFDPDRRYDLHPGIKPTDHFLPLTAKSDSLEERGAMGVDFPGPRNRENDGVDRELAEIRLRNAAFDDANVRNALTDLHERGDAFEKELAALSGPEIGEIVKKTDSFLREQRETLSRNLDGNRQKQLFEHGFTAFSASTINRGRALQAEKTRQYQSEVSERQNRVFLDHALRPENLFDDGVQSGYRNMYLLNVDRQVADLPEEERRDRLDAADRGFCGKILDRRLESNPAKMRSLLGAPAVRRVMGKEMTAEYERRAADAVRSDEIRDAGISWFDRGLPPEEAERKAGETFPDAGEAAASLDQYWRRREKANRRQILETIAKIDGIWLQAVDPGNTDAAVAMLRRRDAELADRLEHHLREKAARGGVPAEGDPGSLLRFVDEYSPRRSGELLQDRNRLLDLYENLGGSASSDFEICLRMLKGEATREDLRRVKDLRYARDAALARSDGGISDEQMGEFLRLYDENARIFLERNNIPELDFSEKRALIDRTWEDMAWK